MSTRTSAVWRLLRITWPFLAIVLLLVLLARESLEIVSATRAYVGGESLWSKAQKEAVYSLFRYAQSRSEADYLAYREAIAVPMGDRSARLELEKPQPDLARAREGFIAGQNDPDDIAAMIMLFRRFREIPLMNKAIAIWAEGDERMAELDALAKELHARIAGGETGPDTLAPILARIDNVNRRLTRLGDRVLQHAGRSLAAGAGHSGRRTRADGRAAGDRRHRPYPVDASIQRCAGAGAARQRGAIRGRGGGQQCRHLGLERALRRGLLFAAVQGAPGLSPVPNSRTTSSRSSTICTPTSARRRSPHSPRT